MRFPVEMTVVVRDRTTKQPISGVAISLLLHAGQKNDYFVGPLITNEDGKVEFTRAGCEFAIERAQEMFVMDYAGNLESCRSPVEVRLHSPEHIERMMQQYETYPDFWGKGFQDPKRLFAELKHSKNAKYEPASTTASEEQLASNPKVELALVRRCS